MNENLSAHAGLDHWLTPHPGPAWQLVRMGYDPTREAHIEACFAISNGLLGSRASRAISRGPMWIAYQHHLSWASWPRTYVAGLYDTPNVLPPVPGLVPVPDWLRARIWVNDSLILLRSGELQAYRRTLDLRRGVLLIDWVQRTPAGHVVHLQSLRAVSLADRGVALQLLRLEVDGAPAKVRLEASFETTGSALDFLHSRGGSAVWRTAESGKTLAICARAGLIGPRDAAETGGPMKWAWTWDQRPGEATDFVRMAVFARGDADAAATERGARRGMARAEAAGWAGVLAAHESAWAERWRYSDVAVEGDGTVQTALRFAVYHLIGATNPEDERVSIGARALTGDSYLGHVFWDTEIYLLPFYIFTWPEAARALLMYRFHTLPGARAKAARLGYRGALYAWESTDTGEETTPETVLLAEGLLVPVLSGLQEQHISADIAYAVWQYWQATRNEEFLLSAGAEILLETARFWGSRATLEEDGRYHIRGVIGPDEYHETIDDNAYTNVMAGWNIERGLETADLMRERWPEAWERLRQRLALDRKELDEWLDVANGLVRGDGDGDGLIEQFAGYFGLEDIDLADYESRIAPMDMVLGRERIAASQVIKQADVVALLALLPDRFDRAAMERNFSYYEPRCGHGSSLSPAFHALVAARLGRVELAERYLHQTARVDLGSPAVNSAGGVHIAAQGGLWMAVVFGFAGVRASGEELTVDPVLPGKWETVAFRLQWRGRVVHVRIDSRRRVVAAMIEQGAPLSIRVKGKTMMLDAGIEREHPY
jgi:trehalose/maltose hydrolase-like predicted phosphorylase